MIEVIHVSVHPFTAVHNPIYNCYTIWSRERSGSGTSFLRAPLAVRHRSLQRIAAITNGLIAYYTACFYGIAFIIAFGGLAL